MQSLIYSIFGSYNPVHYVETVKYWDDVAQDWVTVTNQIIPAGLAGVDWQYLAGVGLFAIVLYGFLRIVGGAVHRV